VVDQGSNMAMKFNPQGQLVMTIGRKPENINVPGGAPGGARGGGGGAPAAGAGRGGPGGAGGGRGAGGGGRAAAADAGEAPAGGRGRGGPPGAGVEGETFNRPSDIAVDGQGNIYLADGYGNSRIAKFDKAGVFVKSWGQTGNGQGQFSSVRSIAADKQGNIYVADHDNKRIQVFDGNGTFKSEITGIGSPSALCISAGAHQYLYSSDSNDTNDFDNGGQIYKLELDGKVLGKFGKPGKLMKEFGTVSAIDCRNENELLVGELTNWRVQKITLRAAR